MKSLFTLAFAIPFFFSQSAFALKVGEAAPSFSLPNALNQSTSLGDYKGKFVVLEWYNKDCPFVKKHYESKNMQNLQKEFTDKGVVWLQIISSAPGKQGYLEPSAAKAQAELMETKATATLIDKQGKVGKSFGAKVTPHMFVINPEGKVVYMGAIDSIESADKADIEKAENYVRKALTEAMAGKPVTTASTSAYGCGIKFP